jgi:hypothetical protein
MFRLLVYPAFAFSTLQHISGDAKRRFREHSNQQSSSAVAGMCGGSRGVILGESISENADYD